MKVKRFKLKSTTEDTECRYSLTEGAQLLGECMESLLLRTVGCGSKEARN